jgi:hypothetical protein
LEHACVRQCLLESSSRSLRIAADGSLPKGSNVEVTISRA